MYFSLHRYIAKTETADLDMDYIAATKLSAGQSRGSFKYNPTRTDSGTTTQNHENTLEFFSQLNPGMFKVLTWLSNVKVGMLHLY